MPPTRCPYPPEFRTQAARLVRISGKTQKEIAADFGVSTESLRKWAYPGPGWRPRRPGFPDRVKRVFSAAAPNGLWVAGLTQHPSEEGWSYLATVIDTFSRRVVGWAMGERPTAALVVDAKLHISARHGTSFLVIAGLGGARGGPRDPVAGAARPDIPSAGAGSLAPHQA